MATLIRSRRWGQMKPPVGAALDWSNPLARGLLWLALPGDEHRRELVSGSFGSLQTNMSWSGAGPIGSAASSSAGANSGIYYPLASASHLTQVADQLTMAGWWRIDAVNAWEHFFILPSSTSGWSLPFGWLAFQRDNASTSGHIQCQGMLATPLIGPVGYLLTDSQFHFYAVTIGKAAGTVNFYRDDVLFGTSTPTITTASIPTPVQTPVLMGRQGPGGDNTAENSQGQMSMFGIWNVALTARDIQQLYVEPYAILQPQAPRSRLYLASTVLASVTIPTTATTSASSSITVTAAPTAILTTPGTTTAAAAPTAPVQSTVTLTTAATATAAPTITVTPADQVGPNTCATATTAPAPSVGVTATVTLVGAGSATAAPTPTLPVTAVVLLATATTTTASPPITVTGRASNIRGYSSSTLAPTGSSTTTLTLVGSSTAGVQ